MTGNPRQQLGSQGPETETTSKLVGPDRAMHAVLDELPRFSQPHEIQTSWFYGATIDGSFTLSTRFQFSLFVQTPKVPTSMMNR